MPKNWGLKFDHHLYHLVNKALPSYKFISSLANISGFHESIVVISSSSCITKAPSLDNHTNDRVISNDSSSIDQLLQLHKLSFIQLCTSFYIENNLSQKQSFQPCHLILEVAFVANHDSCRLPYSLTDILLQNF